MNPQLFLNLSNRQERLAERLAALLAEERRGPLEPAWIVVQHPGMERWLRLQIAALGGLAMGLDFPFPRRAVDGLLEFLLGQSPARGFSRENLAWTIFFELPALAESPNGTELRAYLDGAPQIRRYTFARTLAAMFDRYMIHRPELLCGWLDHDQPAEAHAARPVPAWQPALWRRLCEIHAGAPPFPLLHNRLGAAMQNGVVAPATPGAPNPPHRIHVFGISSLPCAFLDVFAAASCDCEIQFYLLHPTPLFPGDLLSRRGAARTVSPGVEPDFPGPAEDFLATAAMQTGDMINLLIDRGAQQSWEGFEHPAPSTALGRLQAALYDLDTLPTDGSTTGHTPSAGPTGEDRSIVLAGCSTVLREVEVLHDELLRQFQRCPGLKPGDVLVMTPAIERYSAAIHAVFGNTEQGVPRIPYHVADREPRSRLRGIDAFFAMLETAEGRLEAPDVAALLNHEAVRAACTLSNADCERIEGWIRSRGIRWGLNAAHRSRAVGATVEGAGTWERGLDGLLLGIAMNANKDGLFEGLLPAVEMEGERIETLGRFLRVFTMLEPIVADAAAPRPLAEWAGRLLNVASALLSHTEELLPDALEIERALLQLRDLPAAISTEPVDLSAAVAWLRDSVREFGQPGAFLTGGITFCSIRPMRSIPARVMCLLGMNEADFPGKPPGARFDLMESARERGDRRAREDDLQAFLDSLICARDVLYIGWIDRKPDNAQPLPPSPVVAALQTVLDAAGGGNAHAQPASFSAPLQSFSPRYAKADGPGTFSSAAWHAAAAVQQTRPDAARNGPRVVLPEPDADDLDISVDAFLRFFDDPALYLLRRRLGLRLETWKDEPLSESEPFRIDALAAFRLRRAMLIALREGGEEDAEQIGEAAVEAEFHALGALPEEPLRTLQLAAVKHGARGLAKVAKAHGLQGRPCVVQADISLGNVHIQGSIGPVYGDHIVLLHARKFKAQDRLQAWLKHLLANTAAPLRTIAIGLGQNNGADPQIVVHEPCAAGEEPAAHLAALAKEFMRGLRVPLPFTPELSLKYAEDLRKHGDPERAAGKVAGEWEKPPRYGEAQGAGLLHRVLVLPSNPAVDAEFPAVACAVFDPMLDSEAASAPETSAAG